MSVLVPCQYKHGRSLGTTSVCRASDPVGRVLGAPRRSPHVVRLWEIVVASSTVQYSIPSRHSSSPSSRPAPRRAGDPFGREVGDPRSFGTSGRAVQWHNSVVALELYYFYFLAAWSLRHIGVSAWHRVQAHVCVGRVPPWRCVSLGCFLSDSNSRS